jgi:hypothetical protein
MGCLKQLEVGYVVPQNRRKEQGMAPCDASGISTRVPLMPRHGTETRRLIGACTSRQALKVPTA